MVSPILVRFFSLAKCPSRANFDRSHDRFAKIFNFGPILGPFEAKRVLLGALGAQNGAKIENFRKPYRVTYQN